MDSDKIIIRQMVIKKTILDKVKSFFSSDTYMTGFEVTDNSQIPPEIKNIFYHHFGVTK